MANFTASRALVHSSVLCFLTFRGLRIGESANIEEFPFLVGRFLAFRGGFANEERISLSLGRADVGKGCMAGRAGGFNAGRVDCRDGFKTGSWRAKVGDGLIAGRTDAKDDF